MLRAFVIASKMFLEYYKSTKLNNWLKLKSKGVCWVLSLIHLEVEGVDLVADPIYKFIHFTSPVKQRPDEVTERDIIDSPWLQRLRGIHQLENVRFVYPAGEHTRFQHVLGAMHLGGLFAKRLYPSLKNFKKLCPSPNFIEEFLRIAGLVHDVGHGPFGHFFDHNFLKPTYGITHEDIGKEIIVSQLGDLIKRICRSPSGSFRTEESISPEHIAFLIKKGETGGSKYPEWVRMLKPLLTGIYTIDNLDYVARDSLMCGICEAPISVERLLHYSCLTEEGLTLHKKGIESLKMFLNLRSYLYSNVYFHRTVRAFDLHLKEIFPETLKFIVKENPLKKPKSYLEVTEQSLIGAVINWANCSSGTKQKLAKEWRKLLNRETKWKILVEKEESYARTRGLTVMSAEELEQRLREILPEDIKSVEIQVDVASQDPRPENPTRMGDDQLHVFDPETSTVSTHRLDEYLRDIPSLKIHFRLYALDRQNEQLLREAFHKAYERAPMEETSI